MLQEAMKMIKPEMTVSFGGAARLPGLQNTCAMKMNL